MVLVTATDRVALVICWMVDAMVPFIVLLSAAVTIGSWLAAALGAAVSAGLVLAVVAVIASTAGKRVRLDFDENVVVVHNLFRTLRIGAREITGVGTGRWPSFSFVQRGGDPAYLHVRRPGRERTMRVAVHCTFRWASEVRQEAAKAELGRALARSGIDVPSF